MECKAECHQRGDKIDREYAVPRLRAKAIKIVTECDKCQKNKPKRHQPYGLLQPLAPPERPWSSVTMDSIVKLPPSIEPGSKRICDSILVIVDRLTKHAYFIPTNEPIMAADMSYEVIRALTANHEIPDKFITDRDKLFTSAFWKALCARLGAAHKLSTRIHPQTDTGASR